MRSDTDTRRTPVRVWVVMPPAVALALVLFAGIALLPGHAASTAGRTRRC